MSDRLNACIDTAECFAQLFAGEILVVFVAIALMAILRGGNQR